MTVSTPDISFERESNYLVVRAHTRYVLAEKDAACMTIAAAFAAQPIKAALVDLREVPGPYSFMDRFGLGEAAGRYLAGTPIAALLTDEQADPERIGQLAARNRGANVEVFLDLAAARAWMEPYLASEA
jgi:hypothetical protein